MGKLLDERRTKTKERITALRAELARAKQITTGKACVYITGSFARGEASEHSDLDLFIVGQGTRRKPALSRLNEILVKADLIEATKKLKFPEFSGDGQYLIHHTITELVSSLGSLKTMQITLLLPVYCCSSRVVRCLERRFTSK